MISEYLRGLSADTGVVCLLLAIELGRSRSVLTVDGMLIALTLVVVAILPFFLSPEAPSFRTWLLSRLAIAAIGLLVGSSLAESARFVPMFLLIVAAVVSCAIQFYSLFKLRPAD